MKGQQLALGVQLSDAASFGSYFPGPNAEVLRIVSGYLGAPPGNGILLFGAAGTGKTHLLRGLMQAATSQHKTAAYLPLRELAERGPGAFEGLEPYALLCLDDLDAAPADPDLNLALLRLLDARRASHRHVALSTLSAPDRLNLQRPDLATRLAACTVLGLKPLQDDDRRELLHGRARARGLEFADEAVRWLLTQLPRNTASLLAALELLDHASLAAQRRLTLPFVQQTVAPLLQREFPLLAPAQTESG
jgi:DnaA family protein